jgi:signal transduction histidine kinase
MDAGHSIMGRGRVPVRAVAVGAGAVVGKVALSAPQLASGSPALVAITWLVVASFVGVGLGLLATDVPPANGWACLLVAWATVPGDLNSEQWSGSALSAVGYLLEAGYLVAAVALVLRYPAERLAPLHRAIVWALCFAAIGVRIPVIFTTGSLPDNFYRSPAFTQMPFSELWHDVIGVRGGRVLTIVLLLATAAILVHRAVTSSGLARLSLRPLVLIAAACAVAASVDQAIWAFNLTSLRGVNAGMIRDLLAAALPVALLVDLLQRRAARAAIMDAVLGAASTGVGALESAVREILLDPSVRIRLPRGDAGWVGVTGDVDPLPVDDAAHRTTIIETSEGTPLAALTHDPHTVTDDGLLRSTVSAVRIATDNVRLQADLLATMAELRESRTRIVEAGMAERRKVERDLHDGAQQRLLAVAATLAQADLVDDDRVREIVGDARGHLSVALTELRQLARGIHPAALTQGGLAAALPNLCTSLPDVVLRIDPALHHRRPTAAVEAAAYFLVAEAVTNIVRHAPDAPVTVTAQIVGDEIFVEISDGGSGGARIVSGGGLAGLDDRLHALGGQLVVHSDPCPLHQERHGSSLKVALPMTAAAAQPAGSTGQP